MIDGLFGISHVSAVFEPFLDEVVDIFVWMKYHLPLIGEEIVKQNEMDKHFFQGSFVIFCARALPAYVKHINGESYV